MIDLLVVTVGAVGDIAVAVLVVVVVVVYPFTLK